MLGHHQGNTIHTASSYSQNDGGKPPPVIMLVMGLSGCGKSNFINRLMDNQADCLISTGPKLCTRFPRTCRGSKWIGNCEFRFIDTPGFANDTIDDRKVLERLVEYLAPRGDHYDGSAGLPRRVAGLLYIHSEDEPFKGRTSRKTIEMLVKILGEQFLDRVTVLIQSQNGVPNDFAKVIQSEDSPLYPLYCNNIKPWATIPYTQDLQPIEHILETYIEVSPRLAWLAAMEDFAQRDGKKWQYNGVSRHLRELFPDDVGPLIIPDQADVRTRPSGREDELEKALNLLAQKEEEIKALKSAHENELQDIQETSKAKKADHDIQRGGLCNTIRNQEAEITELQSRYSSALEEIEALKQLNSKKDSGILVLQGELAAKNEELMKVEEDNGRAIQELKEKLRAKESEVLELKSRTNGTTTKTTKKQEDEIHRLKAEIHRISAEYGLLRIQMQLQENTEQADIMKALGDINRLVEEFGQTISEHVEMHTEQNPSKKPLQPKDLLSIFGQVKDDLASKIKQDVYLLLEYAVQAVMCDQLYTHLFKPFHPGISDDRNAFVAQIRAQLARQAPQPVSGRWRKDAFNSISKCLALEGHDKSNGERMHRLLTGALIVLLGKCDGIKPEDVLKKHDKALVKLVAKAEEFNHLIKGGVSVLGDFQPIAFPFGRAFQSSYMSEVTSKPKKPIRPETILGTVGLGLTKSYASGGDRVPEETVLNVAKVFGSPK